MVPSKGELATAETMLEQKGNLCRIAARDLANLEPHSEEAKRKKKLLIERLEALGKYALQTADNLRQL